MPQISQLAGTFASQIFWTLLTFGLVFFVVGVGMLPKVLSTMDARDEKIGGDLAAAEAARAAADDAEERWRVQENAARQSVQAKIAEARAKGAAESERTLTAASTRMAAQIAEAEARVAQAREAAAGEIEEAAAELARDIVARLSGVEVTAAEAQMAAKAALNG